MNWIGIEHLHFRWIELINSHFTLLELNIYTLDELNWLIHILHWIGIELLKMNGPNPAYEKHIRSISSSVAQKIDLVRKSFLESSEIRMSYWDVLILLS